MKAPPYLWGAAKGSALLLLVCTRVEDGELDEARQELGGVGELSKFSTGVGPVC